MWFITVTLAAIDNGWNLVSYTVDTVEVSERHTAENSKEHLLAVAMEWKITDKVIAIIHDNASNIIAAMRSTTVLGESVNCFPHSLQCCLNKALEEDALSEILKTHGEKNLGLNTRELMSFTRGLLIGRMAQASLAMFAITFCVQCTIRSLVLKAPMHLRISLESVGFIATPRRAKPVKLSTGYFQEIPRDFPVRLLAIVL